MQIVKVAGHNPRAHHCVERGGSRVVDYALKRLLIVFAMTKLDAVESESARAILPASKSVYKPRHVGKHVAAVENMIAADRIWSVRQGNWLNGGAGAFHNLHRLPPNALAVCVYVCMPKFFGNADTKRRELEIFAFALKRRVERCTIAFVASKKKICSADCTRRPDDKFFSPK